MDSPLSKLLADGINLDSNHLFLVDVAGAFQVERPTERRAFVDLGDAVRFINGRPAKMSAFISPLNQSAEAAIYGLVHEAYELIGSKTYVLSFAGAPSLMLGCMTAHQGRPFEAYRRVYPAAGSDV